MCESKEWEEAIKGWKRSWRGAHTCNHIFILCNQNFGPQSTVQPREYFCLVEEGLVFEQVPVVPGDFVHDGVRAAVVVHVFGEFGDDFADDRFLFVE